MIEPEERVISDALEIPIQQHDLKRITFTGSLVTVVSQVIRIVIQIGSQIVLARLLFPTDFGLLALALPFVALAGLFTDIGVGQSVIQRKFLNTHIVSGLLWASVLIAAVLAVILAATAPLLALAYSEPRLTPIAIILALTLPLGALGGLPASILTRQMNFRALALNEVVASAISTLLTIGLAVMDWSYWALIAGQFANISIGGTLNWRSCKWRPSKPAPLALLRDDLLFGGNLTAANLASFVSTSADNLIIGYFNGPLALGLYDRSYRLVVQPVGQLLSPFARVALPLMSRFDQSPEKYRRSYLSVLCILNFLTVPLMLVCITYGQLIVELLLGDRWSAAGPIFSWISVGGVASATNSSAAWLFISQARTAEYRKVSIQCAIVNLMCFTAGALVSIEMVAALGAIGFVLVSAPLTLYRASRLGPVGMRDILIACIPFTIAGAVTIPLLLLLPYIELSAPATLLSGLCLSYGIFSVVGALIPFHRGLALDVLHQIITLLRGRSPNNV